MCDHCDPLFSCCLPGKQPQAQSSIEWQYGPGMAAGTCFRRLCGGPPGPIPLRDFLNERHRKNPNHGPNGPNIFFNCVPSPSSGPCEASAIDSNTLCQDHSVIWVCLMTISLLIPLGCRTTAAIQPKLVVLYFSSNFLKNSRQTDDSCDRVILARCIYLYFILVHPSQKEPKIGIIDVGRLALATVFPEEAEEPSPHCGHFLWPCDMQPVRLGFQKKLFYCC